MDANADYRLHQAHIQNIEAKFENKHHVMEFDIPDNVTIGMTFLRIKFNFIIGSLDPMEEFVLKYHMIMNGVDEAYGEPQPEAYQDGIRKALAKRKWTAHRTYTGINPSGIETAEKALVSYKEFLAKAISLEDGYAECVSSMMDLQRHDPNHPMVAWAMKYIGGGHGWATTR